MIATENSLAVNGKPLNANGPSKSAHLVEQIRERFFKEEWPANKDLYCPRDIEILKNSEWFVKRYLLACRRNVNDAYDMMKTALHWRKTVGFDEIDDSVFPKEFYEIGGLFGYECDLQGNPVIYLRIRMHIKVKELMEPVQQFLFYTINKVDQESDLKGLVVVFDCSGAGYSNMDLDMLRSLIDVAFKYFPFCIRYVVVYELSWMMNAFRRLALTLVPSSFTSIIRFANKNDITNYIARENLPDFMNGTCKRDYRRVPENCRNVEEVAVERGIPKEEVKRLMGKFEPFLKEARMMIEAKKREEKEVGHGGGIETDSQKEPEVQVIPRESVNSNLDCTDTKPAHLGEIQVASEQMADDAASSASIAVIHSSNRSFAQFASLNPQNNLLFRAIKQTRPKMQSDGEDSGLTAVPTLVSTIMIRNNHQSKPLAFKVQSNNSQRYSVVPSQGVLLPGAFVCIRLTVRENQTVPSTAQDKFLILMTPNINSEKHLKSITEFNMLFMENVNQVYSHRLKVNFEDKEINTNFRKTIVEETKGEKLVEHLKQEVITLQRKCRKLELRESRFNILATLILVGLIMAVLVCTSIWTKCSGTIMDKVAFTMDNYMKPTVKQIDHEL